MTEYEKITDEFLEDMREVRGTDEEFYDGLRYALGEVEIELQAHKETME